MDFIKRIVIKIYNFIIRCLSALIIDKFKRKMFRANHILIKKGYTNSPYCKNSNVGKIYYPIYSKSSALDNNQPDIYNKEGQLLKTFFIRGSIIPIPEVSKYFILDRYNYGLDVHFYTHEAVCEKIGNPKKCYAMFGEPYSIAPASYNIFKQNKGLEKDFDLIFTHHTEFLEKFDNARLFNPFARIWHFMENKTGNLNDLLEYKKKEISILSSDKLFCPLHKYRYELAQKCKKEKLADTFGTFDGGDLIPAEKTLTNYMYSIVIENEIDDYWFTEKILNCFSHLCIPIYLGARKIDKIFNGDGIIKIETKDFDAIDKILKGCNKEEYLSRINAVFDNYKRSMNYINPSNFLYENYLMEDLKKESSKENIIQIK